MISKVFNFNRQVKLAVGDVVYCNTSDGFLLAEIKDIGTWSICVDIEDPFCMGEFYAKDLKVIVNSRNIKLIDYDEVF